MYNVTLWHPEAQIPNLTSAPAVLLACELPLRSGPSDSFRFSKDLRIRTVALGQGFSVSALLTFGARSFFVTGAVL